MSECKFGNYLTKHVCQCKCVFFTCTYFVAIVEMECLRPVYWGKKSEERPCPCCALWKFSGYTCTPARRPWIWIYPWIYPRKNLWIRIWIWMGNFISTTIISSALRGCCAPKFLHALEIGQGYLAHTPTGMGVPPKI